MLSLSPRTLHPAFLAGAPFETGTALRWRFCVPFIGSCSKIGSFRSCSRSLVLSRSCFPGYSIVSSTPPRCVEHLPQGCPYRWKVCGRRIFSGMRSNCAGTTATYGAAPARPTLWLVHSVPRMIMLPACFLSYCLCLSHAYNFSRHYCPGLYTFSRSADWSSLRFSLMCAYSVCTTYGRPALW